MRETTICKLCLEPVNNYFCSTCLEKSVIAWLEKWAPNLIEPLRTLHNRIISQLAITGQNRGVCVKCKRKVEIVICVYCYAKEIYWWLFSKDKNLAREFSKIFDYDFMLSHPENPRERKPEPIVIAERKWEPDFNVCENCGEPSDRLLLHNGSWICEHCLDQL